MYEEGCNYGHSCKISWNKKQNQTKSNLSIQFFVDIKL